MIKTKTCKVCSEDFVYSKDRKITCLPCRAEILKQTYSCGDCGGPRTKQAEKCSDCFEHPSWKAVYSYENPKVQERLHANGYRLMYCGKERGTMFEHRWVMEQSLGRQLVKGENVHHINGDRLDNQIENLELWSTNQPAGQRVTDKVDWAVELLKLYRPELLTLN